MFNLGNCTVTETLGARAGAHVPVANPHESGHIFLGGDMAAGGPGPLDPAFYFHHGYFDKQRVNWQAARIADASSGWGMMSKESGASQMGDNSQVHPEATLGFSPGQYDPLSAWLYVDYGQSFDSSQGVLKPDNTTYQSSFNMPWDRDVMFLRKPASEVDLTWSAERSMTASDAVCGVLYPNHWYTYVESSTSAQAANVNRHRDTPPPSAAPGTSSGAWYEADDGSYAVTPVVLAAFFFGLVIGSVTARVKRRRAAAMAAGRGEIVSKYEPRGGELRHVVQHADDAYDMRPLEQSPSRDEGLVTAPLVKGGGGGHVVGPRTAAASTALVSAERVAALQTEYFADDVPLPDGALRWSEAQLRMYFESGGEASPMV